ncbi:hypothetical protein [Pontibacter harenae]|uniref:hypothetical protein n=1 Tax=Pontibacter harenae TaxID=2894083 RepID=UPI001E38333A|nr:hypothetical protein [Pontibacter harenae]MCC9168601.1 hypothetical protein [Pontibacter harenae]
MLQIRKQTHNYDSYAEQIINYAQKAGYKEIKADFTGYDSPASLTMISQNMTLTPDFSAKRGDNKYYFELVVKNQDDEALNTLVSKWKVLESIAKMKGGDLMLFVPHGSYKFATELIQNHGIDAKLTKMTEIASS